MTQQTHFKIPMPDDVRQWLARAMAAYYPTFRDAEDDRRSTPEVEGRRDAAHERMSALWAEYEAGPLPIQTPADILSELMAVVSSMASSFGAYGFGIPDAARRRLRHQHVPRGRSGGREHHLHR